MRVEVLFCDDVRTEANGKHILIGVYPTDMVPGVLPQNVALSVWMRLYDVGSETPTSAHVTLIPPGGQAVELDVNAQGQGDFDPEIPLILTLTGVLLELRGYGEIAVKVGLNGKTPEKVASLAVRPRKPPR